MRNDSPLADESEEDENFNIITNMMKGFRNISITMTQRQFISNSLLAFKLAHDSQSIIRSVSSLLEKIGKRRGKKSGNSSTLRRSDLKDITKVFSVESIEFFSKLINYSNELGLTWQKHVSDVIKKSGLYQKAISGDLQRFENGCSLLGIIKSNKNPFSHENALLQLLHEVLEQVDFAKPIDLANSKINCSDWGNIQSLNTTISITVEEDNELLLHPVPDWLQDTHKPLYHIGIFIRSCLVGSLDWSSSNSFIAKKDRYNGFKTSYAKRLLGLMHLPQSINGEGAAMGSWLSGLLFHLFQWPGVRIHSNYESWPKTWNLKSIKTLVKNRIKNQQSLFCTLTGIPGYVEKVNLGWDKNKMDLNVVMVQSLLPQKADFKTYGLLLDTPEYRARHRMHVASIAELILHKIYSQETIEEEQSGNVDLIVWPELAVNSDDIDILKRLSDKTGAMIYTGLNFTTLPNISGPNNISKWIIPTKTASGRHFIERLQGKQNMTKDEAAYIMPWRPYQLFIELVHPAFETERGFRLTGSICYDSTDIKLNADLKGKSDAYIIPALNVDVNTFDSMVDALFYHMYQHVVLVNSGEFGGSVAKAPYKERHEKLITHVHGAQQVSISSFKMNMFDFRQLGKSLKSNKQTKARPAG